MELCPVCSIDCVPAWRRVFSQTQRFKCPKCATWIAYRKPKAVPSGLLARAGNPYLSAILLGSAIPAMLIGFGAAMLYFICYSPWRLNAWGLLCLLVLMLGVAVRSDFKGRKRATLERARYQDARSSLDVAREMKETLSTPEGRKGTWVLLVFVLTLATAMPVAAMAAKRLRFVLPGLCVLPNKHHERNPSRE